MISLDIKRTPPLCRLLICNGGSCGQNPDIKPESIKNVWNAEGLHATVAMKICECQDACEHASVARIITAYGTEWFEHLQEQHYQALIEWARECHRTQTLAERPSILERQRFRGHIRE